MSAHKLFTEIRENLDAVLHHETPYTTALWNEFIQQHEADIAGFMQEISVEDFKTVFTHLPDQKRTEVFHELPDVLKVKALASLADDEAITLFNKLSADELADLFDELSDQELKKYLNLLHKQVQDKVLSLLKFNPESAGGIMTTDTLSLIEDYTVNQSIKLLQRLGPNHEIHPQIFVVDRELHLMGHIKVEDLLLHGPQERIASFLRKNELVAHPEQDQETIAKLMVHYNMTLIAVADQDGHFLGIITAETLVDVIVEEASEDASRMAGVMPSKYPYFQTPLLRLFYQRGHILAILLIVESFSTTILHAYETTLGVALYAFIPMLISVGGNTSSQTSAMVIQGMTSGEITFSNVFRFLKRELLIASLLSFGLGIVAFLRVLYSNGSSFQESLVVSLALSSIVLLAAMLGSGIPLVLRRFNIDPAFSAGPFLATIMDILGVLIFCWLSKLILSL